MADEQAPSRDAGAKGDESGENAKASLFKRILNVDRMFSKKLLVTLLVISVLGHVAYLVVDRPETKATKSKSREVTLGEFYFSNAADAGAIIRRVDFRLHVDLLDGTDDVARRRLEQRRSMVQQNIEQLLRRARAVDFTDPVLAELKRQLQETINETISLRGVSDIIITDLAIERRSEKEPKAAVAAHAPARPKKSPDS